MPDKLKIKLLSEIELDRGHCIPYKVLCQCINTVVYHIKKDTKLRDILEGVNFDLDQEDVNKYYFPKFIELLFNEMVHPLKKYKCYPYNNMDDFNYYQKYSSKENK